MRRLIACQECKRQWDVTRYQVGQKLRCVCSHVMEVPRLRSHTPDVHHCEACGAARSDAGSACTYCGATPVADSARMSLICPLCFHRTPKASQFCSTCGESIHATELNAKTGKLTCPRCEKPKLVNRKIGAYFVDECPSCSGMWVEYETFKRLVKQQAARAQEEVNGARTGGPSKSSLTEKVAYIKCPDCQKMMNRFNFARVSGVVVDECHEHGAWLDSDELAKIAAYVATGGLKHTQTLDELDAKVEAVRSREQLANPMHQIPHYTSDREHATPLGGVLELLAKLF